MVRSYIFSQTALSGFLFFNALHYFHLTGPVAFIVSSTMSQNHVFGLFISQDQDTCKGKTIYLY